ncbi:MAG TPA: hypothetical protein VKV17_05390 [Bryobacteraceae bacterium]|nr:hypothetical protein [Bryobacteraceae bacterium]
MPSGCWERPVSFVADRAFRVIYADDRDANGTASAAPELGDLVAKVVDHAIDLLDHCLGQHLHFDTDFHRCDGPASHQVARIHDRSFPRNYFAECAVPAARFNSPALVLYIQNAVLALQGSFFQFLRAADGDQVLVQVHRDKIALARIAMLVYPSFK